MREAIEYYAIKAVERRDPILADKIRRKEENFANLDRNKLPSGLKNVIDRYDGAAIAYDFVFDITEHNDVSAGLGLVWPFNQGPVKVGLNAGAERARENSRNFRIVDTFDKLVILVNPEFCSKFESGENWVYPITGTIGLRELVGTFLDLNQSSNLGGQDGIPTISDIIQFTTRLSASAKPGVEYTTAGKVLQLSTISGGVDINRLDIHKLTIAISLPPENKQINISDLKPGFHGKSLTVAEQRALNEVFYQQKRFLYDRLTRSTAAGVVLVD